MRFLILLILLAAGCHDQRPAAPTAAEQAQLNDAEAMLNALAANAQDSETNGSEAAH